MSPSPFSSEMQWSSGTRTGAAILLLLVSFLLAPSAAIADETYEGRVFDLDYSLGNGWVQMLLVPTSGDPNVIAVTDDPKAVAILASAMATGETLRIRVDSGPPKTITAIRWSRPQIRDLIRP